MSDRRRTYIGLAAIAVAALLIVAAPSGGDFVDLVWSSIQAAFLAVLAISIANYYRSRPMWLIGLSENDRVIFYGAGAIGTLLIVADEHMRSFGGGRAVQIVGVLACAGAMFWVWRQSRRYSF